MPQIFSVGARSNFVNTVAWVAILWATCAGALPFVHRESGEWLASWPGAARLLSVYDDYLPWLTVAGAVFVLSTLTTAVGLLMRLDWARQVFIALLMVAIFANLAGLWLQQEIVQSVVSHTLASTTVPLPAAEALGGLAIASRVLGILMALSLCGLLVWAIVRLTSSPVRQEFV